MQQEEQKIKAIALGIELVRVIYLKRILKKVYSDLTRERGILMGALAGLFEAQYNVLRKTDIRHQKLLMKQ